MKRRQNSSGRHSVESRHPPSLCSVKAARWWHSSCDILSSAPTSGKLLIMSKVRSIAQEKFRTSVNFRISKHVYCSAKVYFPVFLSSSHDKLHLNNCQWTQFAIKNIIFFFFGIPFVIVCTSWVSSPGPIKMTNWCFVFKDLITFECFLLVHLFLKHFVYR